MNSVIDRISKLEKCCCTLNSLIENVGSVGIQHAISDGHTYGSKNGGWSRIDYNDLLNIPAPIVIDDHLDILSNNPVENSVLTNILNTKLEAPDIVSTDNSIDISTLEYGRVDLREKHNFKETDNLSAEEKDGIYKLPTNYINLNYDTVFAKFGNKNFNLSQVWKAIYNNQEFNNDDIQQKIKKVEYFNTDFRGEKSGYYILEDKIVSLKHGNIEPNSAGNAMHVYFNENNLHILDANNANFSSTEDNFIIDLSLSPKIFSGIPLTVLVNSRGRDLIIQDIPPAQYANFDKKNWNYITIHYLGNFNNNDYGDQNYQGTGIDKYRVEVTRFDANYTNYNIVQIESTPTIFLPNTIYFIRNTQEILQTDENGIPITYGEGRHIKDLPQGDGASEQDRNFYIHTSGTESYTRGIYAYITQNDPFSKRIIQDLGINVNSTNDDLNEYYIYWDSRDGAIIDSSSTSQDSLIVHFRNKVKGKTITIVVNPLDKTLILDDIPQEQLSDLKPNEVNVIYVHYIGNINKNILGLGSGTVNLYDIQIRQPIIV